ncbi:beta-13-n-acetylglucosaminyltransferase [Echinococcus granulosus]|uniref:Beta-13-n-acetylglucosaminyltransferase n=1 Tax=Echinococcus granulosus TaxID=6210 RepID=W6U0W0_ECHGR|nr:beta-13-n-acetylglucosaminyltransferase [Echinococcus granulosus]EUB54683.1 beta-13-n-acetylglucosaminyltransferase [Echinococcus granulosus]
MREYSDPRVGDYKDSYYNLNLKLFHTSRWAARFCWPYISIFVFVDHDYVPNPNKLSNLVRDLTPELRENPNQPPLILWTKESSAKPSDTFLVTDNLGDGFLSAYNKAGWVGTRTK